MGLQLKNTLKGVLVFGVFLIKKPVFPFCMTCVLKAALTRLYLRV